MTNLDSIFKSRDITLPTKVCLVKAVVFPVVMYGCESGTVKKAIYTCMHIHTVINIQVINSCAHTCSDTHRSTVTGGDTQRALLQIRSIADGWETA